MYTCEKNFSFVFCLLRYSTLIEATSLNCRRLLRVLLYTLHARVAWNTFAWPFFFFLFQYGIPLVLTLRRSREVCGVTWEWQQMQPNEITKCPGIMSACCAFLAKLLWQTFQCTTLRSYSPFHFRRLPFDIGWTLLWCQILVFWEKGLWCLSFIANPI